jgi:hypothetical protein
MLLLVFFSAMIGFMAVFKPLIVTNKKILLSEQQECACPESGCDEKADGKTNQEDPEWGDEFYIVPYSVLRIHFPTINFRTFLYWVHTLEYFASISIPPPEV